MTIETINGKNYISCAGDGPPASTPEDYSAVPWTQLGEGWGGPQGSTCPKGKYASVSKRANGDWGYVWCV